jgi:hypothetical protein
LVGVGVVTVGAMWFVSVGSAGLELSALQEWVPLALDPLAFVELLGLTQWIFSSVRAVCLELSALVLSASQSALKPSVGVGYGGVGSVRVGTMGSTRLALELSG